MEWNLVWKVEGSCDLNSTHVSIAKGAPWRYWGRVFSNFVSSVIELMGIKLTECFGKVISLFA